MAGTFIPKLRSEDSFTVIRTDEAETTVVIEENEEPAAEETPEEVDEALSRANLRKIINDYEDLSRNVKRAIHKCTFDESEADFIEVSETFEALSENFEDSFTRAIFSGMDAAAN